MTNFLQVVSFDPLIVEPAEGVASVQAGTNVTVDNTDPKNPIVNATGGGGGTGSVTQVAGVSPDGLGHVALTADNIGDGTTNKAYTATEKTKLGAITGTNTGDETTATIKTKLGVTTLSGSNTGDQSIPTSLPPNGPAGGDLAGTFPNPTLAVDRIPKSLGTAKGDLAGFSASGVPARVPAGADGTVPTYDSTAASGLSAQTTLNASSLTLGSTNGVLKKPWGRQAFIGPELWSVTYFDSGTINSIAGNTSTTPSLTGSSTVQHKMTRIPVGKTSSTDGVVQSTYRFDYTITNTAPSGWAYIAIRALTTGGATIAGSEIYLWGAADATTSGYRTAIDYTTASNSGAHWIEVEVGMANNVPSGTLGLSNVSLRQVAAARPYLNVSWLGSNGPLAGSGSGDGLYVDVPVVDPVTGVTKWVRRFFGPDNMLKISPSAATYFTGTYSQNYTTATGSQSGFCANNPISGSSRILHANNCGQIMGVVKTGGTTEYRCNTHGGEWGRTTQTVTDGVLNTTTTITSATANFTTATHGGATVTGTGIPQGTYISSVTNSTTAVLSAAATATASGVTLQFGQYSQDFTFELDYGDGVWVTFNDVGKTHSVRRVRITAHTQVARSDQTTPFANVDNIFTVYDDGTVRFDRTLTFLADQQMSQWFYFMHSFDTTVLEAGRIGYGQQVERQQFDPRQYLTAPVAATAANAATGGTYGALTRTYFTTAITPQGETLLSASVASTTASGTTNSFTVTQPATQTGQTAWAVYDSTGRISPILPVAQTTWVDTAPTYGTQKAPTVNTATVLPGTQQYARLMSDRADWAAFYDGDNSSIVFGTITDRDNALAYPGAVALTAELDSHPGVLKNYWQLWDGNGMQPLSTAATQQSYTQTITNGTVLATTAYSFMYAPLDRVQWHREIANRGQGFKQFNTVYPAT